MKKKLQQPWRLLKKYYRKLSGDRGDDDPFDSPYIVL
jgi:hypothetical protein